MWLGHMVGEYDWACGWGEKLGRMVRARWLECVFEAYSWGVWLERTVGASGYIFGLGA